MDKNGKIYISRHVIFDENKFPYAEKQIGKKDGEQSINNNIRFEPFITEPPSIDRNEEQQRTSNLNTQEETMDRTNKQTNETHNDSEDTNIHQNMQYSEDTENNNHVDNTSNNDTQQQTPP